MKDQVGAPHHCLLRRKIAGESRVGLRIELDVRSFCLNLVVYGEIVAAAFVPQPPGSRKDVDPMAKNSVGMDKLTKAASAAGFAMVSDEEMLAPVPRAVPNPASSWKSASPSRELVPVAASAAASASTTTLRDWWYSLGGRATA
jgi:hypothetical protein